jgi:hypothetical protein
MDRVDVRPGRRGYDYDVMISGERVASVEKSPLIPGDWIGVEIVDDKPRTVRTQSRELCVEAIIKAITEG